MDLLWLLFIGFVIGSIASAIMGGSGVGCLGDIVFGVVGMAIGGWLAKQIGVVPVGWEAELIFGIIGAGLLIGAFRAVSGGWRRSGD